MSARIFVVEDDALTAALLEQYITEMGHQFAGRAGTGETAIEKIRRTRPDLVLMDIRLGADMDGIEAAERLQAERMVALIYITAFADPALLERAKRTGPFGYLVKPINENALKAAIELTLHKVEAERKQQRILDAVVNAMAELVRLHDPYLKDVQARAADLAQAIATELKLPAGEARGIRLAAMLHSVGLVGIPSSLIFSGKSLSDTEAALFKTHPEIAWGLLKDIEFTNPVAEMVYQHMERLDGSGFPRGLSGEAILPGARIVAVACKVARMLTPAGPEAPASAEAIIQALEADRGTRLDAGAVDACICLFRERRDALPA